MPVAGGAGSRWSFTLQGVEIGEGAAIGPPSEHGELEVVFAIAEPYRNLGYGTEAVGAMCERLARDPSVRRVVAVTDGAASRRVLAKAGFSAVVGGRYAMLAG